MLTAPGYCSIRRLPLYTQADGERVLGQFAAVPFDAPIDAAAGVRVDLPPAGHILGAASLTLELDGARRGRSCSAAISGAHVIPLLRPPAPPAAADVMVVESTYGDRRHRGRRVDATISPRRCAGPRRARASR